MWRQCGRVDHISGSPRISFSRSAVVYASGQKIRYGLFGPDALARLAGLSRLRWIRLESIAPLWALPQCISAREEQEVGALSDLLRLYCRRVFDHEIISSPQGYDLLILVSRLPAPFIMNVEATASCRGDVPSAWRDTTIPRGGGRDVGSQCVSPVLCPLKT